jgi:GNAT superfamily N-acetyltransferase
VTPRVRRASAADAPALARLIAEFRDFLEEREPGGAAIERGLARLLVASDATYLVAEQSDGLAGYALLRVRDSLWAEGPEAQLEDLFVRESARGTQTGSLLLEAAIALADDSGCRVIGLTTNERNPALHLYERAGFRAGRARWRDGRQLWLERWTRR